MIMMFDVDNDDDDDDDVDDTVYVDYYEIKRHYAAWVYMCV